MSPEQMGLETSRGCLHADELIQPRILMPLESELQQLPDAALGGEPIGLHAKDLRVLGLNLFCRPIDLNGVLTHQLDLTQGFAVVPFFDQGVHRT
jgi:hypothetical protein